MLEIRNRAACRDVSVAMRRTLLLLPVLLLSAPAWAKEKPLSVEEACAEASLAVLGTLDDAGVLSVKEVLYGRAPAEALRVHWRHWTCFKGHGDKAGKLWIWCLTRAEDGPWHADHSGSVIPLEKRAEVEKAIQNRLAPDRKVLEEAKDLRIEQGESLEEPVEIGALDRLVGSGSAALPSVRALLQSQEPVQRAYGCRLAQESGEASLAVLLLPLLEGRVEVSADYGCYREKVLLAEMALKALGAVAGKPFKDAREARAWADSLKPKSEPPPVP